MGLPPDTKGTGDFKRLLDKLQHENARQTYKLQLPAYLRATGGRALFDLHVLLPHEVLQQELATANLDAPRS